MRLTLATKPGWKVSEKAQWERFVCWNSNFIQGFIHFSHGTFNYSVPYSTQLERLYTWLENILPRKKEKECFLKKTEENLC